MKRFFLLFLVVCVPLCGCKGAGARFEIPQKGRFSVTDELSGVSFTASVDGSFAEFEFSAPETIAGLSATTADGVAYKLEYGGVKAEFTSFSVSAAADFVSALELLSFGYKNSGGTLYAEADGVWAEAVTDGNRIAELSFFNGSQKRKYKIKTEA